MDYQKEKILSSYQREEDQFNHSVKTMHDNLSVAVRASHDRIAKFICQVSLLFGSAWILLISAGKIKESCYSIYLIGLVGLSHVSCIAYCLWIDLSLVDLYSRLALRLSDLTVNARNLLYRRLQKDLNSLNETTNSTIEAVLIEGDQSKWDKDYAGFVSESRDRGASLIKNGYRLYYFFIGTCIISAIELIYFAKLTK